MFLLALFLINFYSISNVIRVKEEIKKQVICLQCLFLSFFDQKKSRVDDF